MTLTWLTRRRWAPPARQPHVFTALPAVFWLPPPSDTAPVCDACNRPVPRPGVWAVVDWRPWWCPPQPSHGRSYCERCLWRWCGLTPADAGHVRFLRRNRTPSVRQEGP